MRKLADYLLLAVKGVCMGAADVIPGVSGGTIAFMTGIYQELIESIKSIDAEAFRLLFKGKFRQFWQKINGSFLISVALGILLSIFSLAKLMTSLLDSHPVEVWSFFFGLILISVFYILKDIKGVRWSDIIMFIAGAALGLFICLASPAETPDAAWFIFLCGAIAICAMILPGISGSFILLLMGKYGYMMEVVGNFKIATLLLFACGAVIGILAFSRIISWLLKSWHNGTLLLLTGIMTGSLLKVWPWKASLESGVDRPLLPSSFGGEPHTTAALICFLAGIALVVTIQTIASKTKK